MPYSFNPFSGNFDNTPSTLKGDSAYSTVLPNSADWTDGYQTGTVYKANSASYATIDFTNDKFFPLSGGLITGDTRINGNVTIFGDLTSTGTQTFANTIFTTTSSLSIVHVGTGPAFWVGNNGSGDIASFNDIDQGIEVLHIGGANGDFPNVGVKTSAPNKDFTVNGEISASNTIWDANGNSNNWNSVYSTVQSNSASNWNYQGSDLKALSANWQNTYTVYSTNSASYATQSHVGSNFLPLTGGTITGGLTSSTLHVNNQFSVSTGLATLFIEAGRVGINTEAPTEVLTVVGNASATGTFFASNGNSDNWNSSYNTVQSNSATNWNYQGTDLKDLSASWQNTYTDYSTNSASYATQSYVGSNFYPLTGGTLNGSVTATDGSFDNLYVSQEDAGPAVLYAFDYKVGINTESPNESLTVAGNISATGIYYGDGSGLTNIGNAGVDSWVIANSANATFDSVSAVSLSGTFYGDGSNLIGASLPGQSDINTLVQTSSASWDYQGTDLKDLSANWQNTYTDYSTNSASYATINFVDSNFLPLSGGAIQGNVSTTGGVTVGDGLGTANLYVSGSKVGINTETPNEALTVVGNISATGTIYTNYLELSDVKFTNEHLLNVSSLTASNNFLKVIVGTNTKYLRLYDVE